MGAQMVNSGVSVRTAVVAPPSTVVVAVMVMGAGSVAREMPTMVPREHIPVWMAVGVAETTV